MSPRAWQLVRWATAACMILLLIGFARSVDWYATWLAARGASTPLLIEASILNFGSLVATGFAWWLFLRPQGVHSFPLALRATIAGSALNNLVMANAGEAARALFVSRASGVESSSVFATLAISRLMHIGAFAILLVGSLWLLPLPAPLAHWRVPSLLVLLALIALVLVVVRRSPGAPRVSRRGAGAMERITAYLSRFLESLTRVATPSRLFAALGLEVINWLCQLATYHLTAKAVGFPITLTGSVAETITAQAGFLVRLTPGNVGVFQLVYVLTAQSLGLAREPAVAVAFLLQALQAVPITLLGALLAPEFVLRGKGAEGPGAGC